MKAFRYLAYAVLVSAIGAEYYSQPYRKVNPPSIYRIEDKVPTQGFKAVCSLYDAEFSWFGSGVLVGPTDILTAAHCIPGLAYVSFDGGRTFIEVLHAEGNPDFNPWGTGGDIGYAILASAPDITPIALHEVEPEVGTHLLQIGYGPDETKRMTQDNVILGFKEGDGLYWYANPSHAIPGDSGGAVLVYDQKDCRYELVGITVTVHWNPRDGEVTYSGATSVEQYERWIADAFTVSLPPICERYE